MSNTFGAGGQQGNIIATIPAPGGGSWVVTSTGAVYAEGGAQYYGGTNTGIGGAVGEDITGASAVAGGYQLVNAQGQTYDFGTGVGQYNSQIGGYNQAPAQATPPSPTGPTQDQTDARTVVDQTLAEYGLQSLSSWAWQEITNGASSSQVLLDMYQTPQFKARFPGIIERQQKGLPPISPADYVNYQDSLAQMESQYGLPKGMLTNASTVAEFIGNDVSTTEVQARVQQGYQAVAYAPPQVQQYFAAQFGASGNGALAAYFLDDSKALPLLEQQAAAAQIGGTAAMGGVQVGVNDAMKLAQMGVTQSQAQSQTQNLEQTADLYQANVTEQPGLTAGQQGIEAAFGLSAAATAQVQQRELERQAAFKGGGSAYEDQYGVAGAGVARTA